MSLIEYKDDFLTLKDGVKLRARIWKPKTNVALPALLMRQPYGRELASTVTYAHPSWWAAKGYLVIIQDVRGQGDSEGEFKGFTQEASDTSETHQWVRSLPECNGLLGTFGFSYQGLTQLLGEEGSRPPDCLAPAMTGINEGEHWSNEGGAFWWHIGISWGLQLAAQKLRRSNNLDGWEEIRESLVSKQYLTKGTHLLQKFDPEGMALKWVKTSESHIKKFETYVPLKTWLKQPMLLIGGWWDPHLKGIIDIYHKSIESGGDPEIHIGPASHLQWWNKTNETQLNFFNHHLKGIYSKPSKSKKNLWNLTRKKWHEEYDCLKSPKRKIWSLHSEGLACANSEEGKIVSESSGEGLITIVHDPWRPVPSIGGHLSPLPGEANRLAIDERGDVAAFTSEPFSREEILIGIPILQINAKSDNSGFDLCIALSIINEKQTEVKQLSTGFLRLVGENAKKSLIRTIHLQPCLASLSIGTRFRISIAGAAWPAIAVNPGTQNYPCIHPNPNCLITSIYIDLLKSKFFFKPIFTK